MNYGINEIINSVNDCFVIVDKDRRILDVNSKLCELIGLTRSELINEVLCEMLSFTNKESISVCPLRDAIERKESFRFHHEDYILVKGESFRLVDGQVELLKTKGQITGAIMTFGDVTELVQARDKLLKSEEKYKSLYNQMTNSYTLREVVYDENGEPYDYLYVEVNPAFEKLIGKTREEIIGKTYRKLFPDNEDFWIESYHYVTQKKESKVFEGYVPSIGKYLRTYVFMVTDDLTGFIATDITKQKELEAQLAKEKEFFEKLFVSLDNAYAICELLGDKNNIDFRYIEANPKFLEYVGIRREELLGKKASELFSDNIRKNPVGTDVLLNAYYNAVAKNETQRFDIYSSLMKRHLEVIVYSQEDNVFATEYIDITERKKLQDSLKEEQEKYLELFNSMNEGLVLLEQIYNQNENIVDFRVLDFNREGENIVGVKANEIIGLKASTFFALNGYDVSLSMKELLDVCKAVSSQTSRSNIGVKIEAFGKVLSTSSFKPSEHTLAIIFSDITRQDELERLIKEEREQLDLVFNASLSAFAVIEMICDDNENFIDYIFKKVNPKFSEMTKKDESEIVGLRASELYDIDIYRDGSMFYDYINVLSTGEPVNREFYSIAYNAYLDITVTKLKGNTLAISFSDITEKKQMHEQLRKNLKTLKQSQAIADIGSWEYNLSADEMVLSEEAKIILGAYDDYLVTMERILELTYVSDRSILKKNLAKVLENDELEIDFRIRAKKGETDEIIHLQVRGEISYEDGAKIVTGVIQDITNLVKAQVNLTKSEARFRAILSNTTDVVLIYDKDLNLIFRSDNVENVLGWSNEELEERGDFTLLHPDEKDKIINYMQEIIQQGLGSKIEFETRILTKTGNYIYTRNTMLNMIDDPDIQGLLINYSDITEIKNREKEIVYLSNFDALTGLYNRSYFERNQKEIDKAKNLPLSIVIGDLNGLKLINDMLGHEKGDEVLKRMSDIIMDACEDHYIPIRYGGDEYCVVMPNTTRDQAQDFIKLIKNKCEEDKLSSKSEIFHLNIALGCDTKEDMEDNLSKVLRSAEDSMYKDKLFEGRSVHSASSLISSIKAALHEKSYETEEHSARLAKYSKEVGKRLGLVDFQLNELAFAAELHDIGKIGVDDSILVKNGPLDGEEAEKVKEHPEIGYRIAKASPELSSIAEYILYHHERWDGKGYPFGIKGENIPLYSRIISVIDSFDVMTSGRPYKKAMTTCEAIKELVKCKGTQFDPKIVDIFVNDVLSEKLNFDK